MADEDLGAYEITIRADVSSLEEAQKAADRAENSAEQLSDAFGKQGRASDVARAATIKFNQSLGKLDNDLRAGTITATQYSQRLAVLETNYQKFNGSVNESVPIFSRFSSQIQNAGFQVGDFATQIASGQNAVVALSQQLPQLLGGLGVFGALAGAATAVGGALFLYNQALDESEEETREYRTEVELLRDSLLSLSDARRQEAAADPVNLLGNIESQRRALEDLIDQLNAISSGQAAVDLVDPFSSRSGGNIEFRAENYEALDALVKSTAQTITDLTGEEVELNTTYGSRVALLEAAQKLRADALIAVRELGQSESQVSDEINEQNTAEQEAQVTAEARLSVLNDQLSAIQGGASALESQQSLARQGLIDQLAAKGVAEETAAALVDQEAALKEAVKLEKDRLANIQTNISAKQKETDFLGDFLAQQERANRQEQQRVALANQSAEVQREALRDQLSALQNGASATNAAFAAQQRLLREQLKSRKVAEETVDEILRLRAEVRAAGQEAGSELSAGFESAGSQIAASVTDAVISGDWDNTGQQIGSVLGAAIGTAVAGPVGGAVGGVLGGSLFGGGSSGSRVRSGDEIRSGQLTGEVFGSIDERTGAISEFTKSTADSVAELVGVNRQLLQAQIGADQAIDRFGAQVIAAVEGQTSFIQGAGVGVSGTLSSPELQGLFTNERIARTLPEPDLERLRQLLSAATEATTEVVSEAFSALGLDAAQAINQATFDTGLLSLKDLDSEQAAEEFSRLFGSIINQVAAQTSPELQAFVDQFGESAGSVLQEFANNTTVATASLSGLNTSLDTLTGLDLGQAATDLVEVFGDNGALASAASRIFSTFATEEQQSEQNIANLTREFNELGRSIPQTREELFAFVQSLDLTTEAGRNALAAVDRSTQGLDQLYDEQEERVEEYAKAAREAFNDLQGATDSALSALRRSIDAQQQAIRESLSSQVSVLREQRQAALDANSIQIEANRELVRAIESELRGIQSAYDSLRGSSEALVEIDRQQGLAELRQSLATGDLSGAGDAAKDAANINRDILSSSLEFERQQGQTIALLDTLNEGGASQLTTAELQLESSKAQTRVIRTGFDEMISDAEAAADAQIESLESLYDAQAETVDVIRGVDNSILGVHEAVDRLSNAILEEIATRDSLEEQPTGPTLADVAELFGALTGNQLDQEGIDYFGGRLAAGDSLADIAYIIQQHILDGIPQFANGGVHSGGARIVGELGPELEFTGASRIVSNGVMGDILEIGTQFAQLRADMRGYFFQLAKTNDKIYRQLNRWDIDGLPEVRADISA